ncbi:hypothetical protein N9W34_03320 [Rickettsiales bacterium]|nr:hypothetical protein [Rickettsiales bacterium]
MSSQKENGDNKKPEDQQRDEEHKYSGEVLTRSSLEREAEELSVDEAEKLKEMIKRKREVRSQSDGRRGSLEELFKKPSQDENHSLSVAGNGEKKSKPSRRSSFQGFNTKVVGRGDGVKSLQDALGILLDEGANDVAKGEKTADEVAEDLARLSTEAVRHNMDEGERSAADDSRRPSITIGDVEITSDPTAEQVAAILVAREAERDEGKGLADKVQGKKREEVKKRS